MTTVDSEEKRIVFVQIEIETLGQVLAERMRQEAKWGEQNHPNVALETQSDLQESGLDPSLNEAVDVTFKVHQITPASIARVLCQTAARNGSVTWTHIAQEEFSEAVEAAARAAFAEPRSVTRVQHLEDLRTELIQCAAVFSAWAGAVDRQIQRELSLPTNRREEDAAS